MPIEIAIPFRLDDTHQIATESNPNGQIRQHVLSLINTEPGERVVVCDYGVPLHDSLFEGDDETVANDLADTIQAAFARWEPGIALHHVGRVPGPRGDGLATVDVKYLRTDAPDTPTAGRRTNIAVVRIGGHVTEVVRG